MAAAMERRYWVLLVVLVLLAAGTQWLRWLWRERPDAETFAGPPRSDYTLTRFTMDALDTSGKRTFRISGPFLARRLDGKMTRVNSTHSPHLGMP